MRGSCTSRFIPDKYQSYTCPVFFLPVRVKFYQCSTDIVSRAEVMQYDGTGKNE